MKRFTALMLAVILLMCATPISALARAKQMNDDVPVWTEATVRQYALDYIEGKSMSRLWGYYDLQIRRYMPMLTYEAILTDLEWMTGSFIELGSYRYFDEADIESRTHVLHLCMEKQDLDMYLTHKNEEDDWEIMALEFVPSAEEPISDSREMLVGDGSRDAVYATPSYTETEVIIGTAPSVLSGVLTMPADASADVPVPACVLVHDFGALDRDHTQGNTVFFKDLAQAFAGMGVATIRYDKRSYTYPDATAETVMDEVISDALAASKLLLADTRVDKQRIVVVGLGQGGILAPRIASESDGAFTGLIMIGSTPKTLLTIAYEENADAVAALSDEERATVENAVRKMSGLKQSAASELTLFGKNGYYYWESERDDPVKLMKKLKLPTYIVQGKQDPVVSENEGWRAWSEAIGDNITYVSFKSFRGLNHLLMNDLTAKQGETPTYEVAAKLDTQAGRGLAQWVLALYQIDEE